ncbi:MAG: hypothetical protein KJT03_02025 [Verrucomicrobiae bacterium]|nr:hypothetical protein [Verrucomicrobiae bacterium]
MAYPLRSLSTLMLLLGWLACSNKPQTVQELFPDMVVDEKAAAKQFVVKATGTDPLIDDLEDGDLVGLKTDGRNWTWEQIDDATDGTQYMTIVQPPDAPVPGKHALYIRGGGWTNSGAGVSANLVYNATPRSYGSYDASPYTGIRFWVKARGLSELTVRISTPETTASYNGGICRDHCPHSFSSVVAVGENWIQAEIPFGAFTLTNGKQSLSVDPTRIKGIEFAFGTEGDYEAWLDELSFYRQ